MVLWSGGIGTALLIASVAVIFFLQGSVLGIVFGALLFLGFTLLSISFKLNKSRDISIMFNLPALLGMITLIYHIAIIANHVLFLSIIDYLPIIYLSLILLMPIIYNLVKLLRCKIKVDAHCVDVKVIRSFKGKRETYIPYWAYFYNNKEYIHKGFNTRHMIKDENIVLRINPKEPHDVHYRIMPDCCILNMIFCALMMFIVFYS